MFHFSENQFQYKFPPFRFWKVNLRLMYILCLHPLRENPWWISCCWVCWKILSKSNLIILCEIEQNLKYSNLNVHKKIYLYNPEFAKEIFKGQTISFFLRILKGKIWFVEDFLSTNWIHFLLIHLSHFSNIINQFSKKIYKFTIICHLLWNIYKFKRRTNVIG